MYNMDNASYNASYGNGTHKSGYYYNYCAASAGSYCYARASAPSNTNATQDICPAGWQMLAGDSSTYSYQKLYEAYGSNAVKFKNALHAGLSGYFDNNIYNQGTYGNFWASTYESTNSMRSLLVNASSVSLQSNNNRNVGLSVRCVLKSRFMQDVSSVDLATMMPNNGNVTTLADKRDGEFYTIGKLADGKYWMLDNLALGGSSALTLTGEDTNLATASTKYILPASGTVCFTDRSCTGTAGSNNTNIYATKSGTGYTVAAINADYKTTTSANNTDFTYNSNGDVSKAGVYYNYCAASAGTICAASGSNNDSASYDICPKGWRLPTGGDSGEFRALANNLGNVTTGNLTGDAYTDFKAAFHAGLSGYFGNGSVQDQTSGVGFWSSTPLGGYSMYDLYLSTTTVSPQNSRNRYYGLSVRCVMK